MPLPQSKTSICFFLPLLAVSTLSLPVQPASAQTKPNQKPEQKTKAAGATYRIPVKDKYGLPIAQIEYLLMTGNSKGALAALAKVPRSKGDEDRRNMILAAAKANDNDFDGALPLFSRIKVMEGTPCEFYLAAKTFAIAQDFPKAIEMASKGIAQTDNQKCLEIRATAYSNIGRFQEAIQDYETLARVYPAWAADYLSRASATLIKINKPKEALIMADRAIAGNDKEPGPHFIRATCLRELGRFTEAVDACTKAVHCAKVRMSKNREAAFLMVRAMEERAKCYHNLGKLKEEAADRAEIKRYSDEVMNEMIGR